MLDSAPLSWDGMALKGYRYADQDVLIPAMRDYMIVVYKHGEADMSQRCGGPWHTERVEPGVVSVLTRAEISQWRWSKPIEVSHLYMSQTAIADIAGDVFERDIKDVEMRHMVRSEDPILASLVERLAFELDDGGLGGRLYAEAVRNQACIHLLRHYASVSFRDNGAHGRFSPTQRRLLIEYIDENRCENISLSDLAGVLNLSTFHFTRKFREEFGCPPHAYLIQERIKHATRLLARKDVPLKDVAARAGFADQSHMTRLFRRFLDMTPGDYRRDSTKQ
jgi:AraC family transcriptional regulator